MAKKTNNNLPDGFYALIVGCTNSDSKRYKKEFENFIKGKGTSFIENRQSSIDMELCKNTALIFFCRSLYTPNDLIELLLKNDTDPNIKDEYNWCPIHYACQNGNENATKLLVQYGADVNKRTDDNNTALHYRGGGSLDIIEFLVNNGAEIDVKNDIGETPMDIADSYDNDEVYDFLEQKLKEQKIEKQTAKLPAVGTTIFSI